VLVAEGLKAGYCEISVRERRVDATENRSVDDVADEALDADVRQRRRPGNPTAPSQIGITITASASQTRRP